MAFTNLWRKKIIILGAFIYLRSTLSFPDFAGVWATIDSFGIPSAMSAVDHSQYITNSQNKKPQKVVGRLKMALNVLFTRTAHQLMTEVTEEQATRNYTSPKQEHLTSK